MVFMHGIVTTLHTAVFVLLVEYRILSAILYAKLFDPQEDSCSNNASLARRAIICTW